MKNILDWIARHKKLLIILLVVAVLFPVVFIHFLFKIKTNCYWIQAEWSAGDALGYAGNVFSFVGTVVLGYVAICQTEKANSLSNEILSLEWEKRKPYLDIVQNQEYDLHFGYENISNCLAEYSLVEDMIIRPCYIKQERTGITTEIAAMKIVVKNIGNSDIRYIYIKTNYCYLSPMDVEGCDNCVAHMLEGNTYIKAGESKNLYIEFSQELDDDMSSINEQIDWAVDSIKMIPAFDFDLHLITSEGNEYMENLVCGTSISVETNEIKRTFGTISISVKKLE